MMRRPLAATLGLAALGGCLRPVFAQTPVPLPPERPAEFRVAPRVASDVPLPPVRPPEFGAVTPSTAPAPAATAPGGAPAPVEMGSESPPEDSADCTALFAAGHVSGALAPPIRAGACGIAAGIELKAIQIDGGEPVSLRPSAVMRCSLAKTVADWVREDLAPAAAASGAPLDALEVAGAYECRNRDRLPNTRLSEHATGNAIDIAALVRRDGKRLPLVGALPSDPLAVRLRETTCARFTTVLGPGSDPFHGDHMHVDLAARRNGYRICQWAPN